MKIRNKRIWLVLAALLMLVLAVSVWWMAARRTPAQIITLSDGRQFRFAGVDWGTNHSEPRFLARIVGHLPDHWAAYVRAKLGPRAGLDYPSSTVPALGVWLEAVVTNATIPIPNGQGLRIRGVLADEKGVSSGLAGFPTWVGVSPRWILLEFSKVPRRSRWLECSVLEPSGYFSSQDGRVLGSVKFPNPSFAQFPQWQPEALPAVKSAGELRVQLNRFAAPDTGASEGERYTHFSLSSAWGPNEKWTLETMELSDATGNRMAEDSPPREGPGDYSIQGALWPDEGALRLKLGYKRTAGFPAGDLIIFTNLPLPNASTPFGPTPTNGTSLTNRAGGTPVVLNNIAGTYAGSGLPPGARGPFWLEVQLPDDPAGMVADIVKVVTDTGEELARPDADIVHLSAWNFRSVPAGAKFFNVTVAVQKKRYVEFFVKPDGKQ